MRSEYAFIIDLIDLIVGLSTDQMKTGVFLFQFSLLLILSLILLLSFKSATFAFKISIKRKFSNLENEILITFYKSIFMFASKDLRII